MQMDNKTIIPKLLKSFTRDFSFRIKFTNKKHVHKNQHVTYWDTFYTVATPFDFTAVMYI